MRNFICETCGTQYKISAVEPETCLICTDERQYINTKGQSWTTLEEMNKGLFKNSITKDEAQLHSIKTEPKFGLGQTAYLIKENGFNLLWDCIPYIDSETENKINEMGGIQAIALSHPHFYSTQVEWAERFEALIYIHEDDKEWVMRESDRIIFWSGESFQLHEEIILHRLGGHFKGGTVIEWTSGNEGKGILLTGDTIHVVAEQEWVSFMYSYPNLIPLPVAKVEEIAARVRNMRFDRLYGAYHGTIKQDANFSVQKSAHRYICALNGTLFNT